MLSIVIPFIDQPEITRRCLQLLAANTVGDYELILIDNGSERPLALDRTASLHSQWRYLRNGTNVGVLRSIQQGLACASNQVMVFMHNDVLIHETGWNQRVEAAFESDPQLGLAGFVGARGCGKDGGRLHTMSNMAGEEWGVTPVKPAALHHGGLLTGQAPAAVLDGLAMIFRKDAVEQVAAATNIFGPDRAPHHWYDRNISLHFLKEGQHVSVIGIRIDHWSGATANRSGTYRDSADAWCRTHGVPLIDGDPDFTLYKYGEQQFLHEWSDRLPVTVSGDHTVVWHGRPDGCVRVPRPVASAPTRPVKVGITVPCLDNFRGLAETIWSARSAHHDLQIYPIPNWRFHFSVAKSWNIGIRQAGQDGCRYVLVVNDDVLLSPWTIDNLVAGLEASTEDVVMLTGCNVRSLVLDPDETLTIPAPTDTDMSPHPDFSCFMVRPDILDQVGTFDEHFSPAYFEDNDYHYRMQLLGLTAFATPQAPYYHFGSVTQNGGRVPVVPANVFEANRAYYVRKWGGIPGEESFSTPFDRRGASPKDWGAPQGN